MAQHDDFAVQYRQADKRGQIKNKQKNFKNTQAMHRWIAKFMDMDGALEILAFREDESGSPENHAADFHCAKQEV